MRTPDLPIALIGLMGAGKTSVAHLLGQRLGTPVADLDALIEAEAGCTVAALFERDGEPAFRRREGELLERALGSGAGIVACGGGIVLEPAHRATLRARCRTVWLEVSPGEAARRLIDQRDGRPLLRGGPPEERLRALLEERAALYGEVARVRVSTDARSPAEVASGVLAALGAEPG